MKVVQGAVLALLLTTTSVRADWIESLMDERCAPEDVENISNEIRDTIEAAVRRAEASIQAPIAVGDLSCLEDLMKQPLAIFSGLGNLAGQLQGGFQNFDFDVDMDIAGMVCDFAAERWAELTEGLGDIEATIQQFADTPAKLADRLQNGGGFGSGSGSSQSTGRLNTSYSGNSQMSNDQDQPPNTWQPNDGAYTAGGANAQNSALDQDDQTSTGGIQNNNPPPSSGTTFITPSTGQNIDYSDPNQNPSRNDPQRIYYGYDQNGNFVMFKRDPNTGEPVFPDDPNYRTNGSNNTSSTQDNRDSSNGFSPQRAPSNESGTESRNNVWSNM